MGRAKGAARGLDLPVGEGDKGAVKRVPVAEKAVQARANKGRMVMAQMGRAAGQMVTAGLGGQVA